MLKIAGFQGQVTLARVESQRIVRANHLNVLHEFHPLGHTRTRNRHHLVALAANHFRQLADREHQQPTFIGNQRNAVIRRGGNRLWRQHARTLGNIKHRLARFLVRQQVRIAHHETVTGIRAHQVGILVLAHHRRHKAGAGRRTHPARQGLTLPPRTGQGVRRQRIGPPGAVDKADRLVGFAFGTGLVLVASLVTEPFHVHFVPLGSTHPAFFRQHHGHRVGAEQVGLIQGLGVIALHQRRAAIITVFLGVILQLFGYQLLHFRHGAQSGFQVFAFFVELVLLTANFHFFQFRQVAQLQFQNRFRLTVADTKPFHQYRLGSIFSTDDMNHFINIQECRQQAFQDVQAFQHLVETVLQTTAHRDHAELQPLVQNHVQAFHLGPAIDADHVQVNPVILFQVGAGKQVTHQLFHIHPVGARRNHQASGILMVGFVTQIADHGQLFLVHLIGDLFQHLGPGNLIRQRGHHNIAIFAFVHCSLLQRAFALGIHANDVVDRGDHFRFGREIRALDVLHQVIQRGAGIFQQVNTGIGHFAQIVRRNIRAHAHGNAGGAIEQHIGQPGRQQLGLIHGAIEIGQPFHRSLAQLGQQHFRIRRQLGFRITHGGKRFRVVRTTPVPLTIHQRIAVTERLRHQHHGFVAGRVPMRMILTQHITHRTGGLLVLGRGLQAQLTHGVHDTPLHRLKAVTNIGKGPIQNHVHGIIQVRFFGVFL